MDAFQALQQRVAHLERQIRQIVLVDSRQESSIAALAAALVKVDAKTQRATTTLTNLAVGSLDVTITWPQPWPDTAYGIIPTIVSGIAALGSLTATLKSGTKTAADCVVTIANGGAGVVASVGLDVFGVRT